MDLPSSSHRTVAINVFSAYLPAQEAAVLSSECGSVEVETMLGHTLRPYSLSVSTGEEEDQADWALGLYRLGSIL